MNTRVSITAAGTAAALVTGGCLLALPASAGSASHTVHFSSLARSQAGLGKTGGVAYDHDVAGGKLIGYDVLTFTGHETGDAAVALKGGFLYASLHFAKSGKLTGSVTGGSGPYAGARGTVTGQAISNKKTKVTIVWH